MGPSYGSRIVSNLELQSYINLKQITNHFPSCLTTDFFESIMRFVTVQWKFSVLKYIHNFLFCKVSYLRDRIRFLYIMISWTMKGLWFMSLGWFVPQVQRCLKSVARSCEGLKPRMHHSTPSIWRVSFIYFFSKHSINDFWWFIISISHTCP